MSEVINHNHDILTCLSNLSNDEVFTPPEIANAVLDMIPEEFWKDPSVKVLDPACKSGVFLREAAKRFIKGLEEIIPDLQERIDHIFHKQLFGYAITELTSYLSRRSVYCSKTANGSYSITRFEGMQGNILYKRIEHTWINKKCSLCGASRNTNDRGTEAETHAYEFIHLSEKKLMELKNMKFDLIISNPPYQLNDGGAQASAIPIYQKFIEQAKKLNPRFITMIIPARWYTGGRGLDDFRNKMLLDHRIRVLHDFVNASDCFNGVSIKGGVCFFLWNRDNKGDCEIISHEENGVISNAIRPLKEEGCDFFIRYNKLISIYHKIRNEKSFMIKVSAMRPFGLRGDFFKNPQKYNLPNISTNPIDNGITIYGLNESQKRVKRYVANDYPIPDKTYLKCYKLFISRNQGSGILGETFSAPIYAKPNECCTETFIVMGGFDSIIELKNCYTYICTKFFRAAVGIKKNDQGAARSIYQFVPMQDFTDSSDIDWSKPITEIDQQLYRKYKLTEEEISFIETMIKPMDKENENE